MGLVEPGVRSQGFRARGQGARAAQVSRMGWPWMGVRGGAGRGRAGGSMGRAGAHVLGRGSGGRGACARTTQGHRPRHEVRAGGINAHLILL